MGYSMRTDRYRLVQWRDYRDKDRPPIYTELYDHRTDPQETTNVAAEKPKIVAQLGQQLLRKIKPE